MANIATFEAVTESNLGDITGTKEDFEAVIQLLTRNLVIMSAGLLEIQVVHELGHAFMSWKNKVRGEKLLVQPTKKQFVVKK